MNVSHVLRVRRNRLLVFIALVAGATCAVVGALVGSRTALGVGVALAAVVQVLCVKAVAELVGLESRRPPAVTEAEHADLARQLGELASFGDVAVASLERRLEAVEPAVEELRPSIAACETRVTALEDRAPSRRFRLASAGPGRPRELSLSDALAATTIETTAVRR